ncbi:hypothetical protein FNL39_106264 [Nocardia caishijiensis]|uniref:Uncharacterized protein n=1 Tax=Nocardia caishijiensis TaxID=184756 RepID=A0ABQ6YJB3_9NOCA|nr:hypothetical protein FNL39_106264 [Nocardia caishijiensis]
MAAMIGIQPRCHPVMSVAAAAYLRVRLSPTTLVGLR